MSSQVKLLGELASTTASFTNMTVFLSLSCYYPWPSLGLQSSESCKFNVHNDALVRKKWEERQKREKS